MPNIVEGLEIGDLKRVVHPELHVDEFQSKLGDDRDVIVLSFKVLDKMPAEDLVNFAEKGYSWVIDSDLSSGEMDDGSYLVFLEIERRPDAISEIDQFMNDLMNLTEQDLKTWRIRYHKNRKELKYSVDALKELIPDSPEKYDRLYGDEELNEMRTAAGLPVNSKAPINDFTESLRNLAGIQR